MKESTAKWLHPIQERAHAAGIDFHQIMSNVVFPTREADDPILESLPTPEGVESMAIDWIRFGHELQDRMGEDRTWPKSPN